MVSSGGRVIHEIAFLCMISIAGLVTAWSFPYSVLVSQEANLMSNYGLSPGTLKGELFSILLNQGNNGMKVSDLVKIPSVS